MAKTVKIDWVDSSPTTNVDHIEIWRSVSDGAFAPLTGATAISLGVETFTDDNAGAGFPDGTDLDYEVRSYNNLGGDVLGVDYNMVTDNIVITGATIPYLVFDSTLDELGKTAVITGQGTGVTKIEVRTKIYLDGFGASERVFSFGSGTSSSNVFCGISAGKFIVGHSSGFHNYNIADVMGRDLRMVFDTVTTTMTAELYIDEVLKTPLSTSGTFGAIAVANTQFVLGGSNASVAGTNEWDGYIYPTQLYLNDVLESDWRMTEGTGATLVDSESGNDITLESTGTINDMWNDGSAVYKALFTSGESQYATTSLDSSGVNIFKLEYILQNASNNTADKHIGWGTLVMGYTTGNFIYIGTSSGFDKYPLQMANAVGKPIVGTYNETTFETSISVDGVPLVKDSTAGTKPAISGTEVKIPYSQGANLSYSSLKLYNDTTLLSQFDFKDGIGRYIVDKVGGKTLTIDAGTGSLDTIWVAI